MAKKSTAMADTDWQAQSDMRTLVEAQQIRDDPKRFKAAQAEAKKQAEALEEAFEPAGEDTPAEEAAESKSKK